VWGENVLTQTDNAVFLKPAVSTVDEAIERMEEITAYLDATSPRGSEDGLACFNFLYTTITKRVRDGINSGFFEDKAFLSQLDVDFANRYFNALRLFVVDEKDTPRSWAVLLEKRLEEDIESIQFAVAGVNAHVNFDLALAVVMTCAALRTEPAYGTQHDDYLKINQIFSEEMQALRQHYESNAVRRVDGALSPVLNLVCDWSVEMARDAAWEAAEHLWMLRRVDVAEEILTKKLDGLAALSGHLLLASVV
jgi:hypothetical protein